MRRQPYGHDPNQKSRASNTKNCTNMWGTTSNPRWRGRTRKSKDVRSSRNSSTFRAAPRSTLWDPDRRHRVKLYVRPVFIMDSAEQLLPVYLRFVRGIIDSSDLPFNISREILQQSPDIAQIRAASIKRMT